MANLRAKFHEQRDKCYEQSFKAASHARCWQEWSKRHLEQIQASHLVHVHESLDPFVMGNSHPRHHKRQVLLSPCSHSRRFVLCCVQSQKTISALFCNYMMDVSQIRPSYDTELKPNQKQHKLTPYSDGLSTHLQI